MKRRASSPQSRATRSATKRIRNNIAKRILPSTILHQITSHLSSTDIVSVRHTCRALHKALPPPPRPPFSLLETLSTELLLFITSHLPPPSATHLRATCRTLYLALPSDRVLAVPSKHQSRLVTLPYPLQKRIASHLAGPEKVLLRLTCFALYWRLKAPTPKQLREIERSVYNVHNRALKLCERCRRLQSCMAWGPMGRHRKITCAHCGEVRLLEWKEKEAAVDRKARLWTEMMPLRWLRRAQGLRRGWWDREEVVGMCTVGRRRWMESWSTRWDEKMIGRSAG